MSGFNKSALAGFMFLIPWLVEGQYVKNVTYALGKDSLNASRYLITYDLIAPYNTIPCIVKLRLTTGDKGEQTYYLKDVTGDVGDLVYPGIKKLIVWDYVEELVHFSGEISLSVEVTPSVKVPTKIKKGKQLTVALASIYTPDKIYAVKLYQAGKELAHLSDLQLKEKSFQVLVPKKTKVKNKYQLVINDGEKNYFSNTFKVKPVVSYSWALVPLLGIPAYLVINQYIEENKPLPGPPPDITGN